MARQPRPDHPSGGTQVIDPDILRRTRITAAASAIVAGILLAITIAAGGAW